MAKSQKNQKVTSDVMEELLSSHSIPLTYLSKGDVVEGTIISLTDSEALVDVGAKAEGILPFSEADPEELKKGRQILVYVLTPEDRRGQLLLSANRAQTVGGWLKLDKAQEQDQILEAEVAGYNKGGLLVKIFGLSGFVPFSHTVDVPSQNLSQSELQSALDKMRGGKIKVKILELNKDQERIILSQRDAHKEVREKEMQKALEELKVGERLEAEITQVMPYGLVVGTGGVTGLIPRDELSWGKEIGLADFSPGNKVKAQVEELDPANLRLRLSIKRLTPDPWLKLAGKFKRGEKVEGEITKITSFGLLLDLKDGLEGLLPLSELPEDKREVRVGEKLKLAVKAVDGKNRRLELGMG